jgi:excisionase family DNA binding protein
MTELMTRRELAEWLRIRPRTVLDWTKRGVIPALRMSHKIVRYDPAAVLEAIRERQGASDAK